MLLEITNIQDHCVDTSHIVTYIGKWRDIDVEIVDYISDGQGVYIYQTHDNDEQAYNHVRELRKIRDTYEVNGGFADLTFIEFIERLFPDEN